MDENEDDYREVLNEHRVQIVQCLDLDRQYIFCHLRSKFVLDDEDCEIILNAGPSRQQKSQKFIDRLCTKGPEAVHHFIDALEIEHPHLYEVLTGKKPVSQASNPSPTNVVPWAVLRDKQLLDFDREYLVKEFSRVSEINRTMAYMQTKLIKEKHILERKNTELLQELQDRDYEIREFQKEKKTSNEEEHNYTEHLERLRKCSANCQQLLSSNNEKSEIIILLQSRLLAINEQIERSKNINDQLRRKNEYLTKQVRDLTINCDWERIQSKRLSKQVDEKKTEIERNRDAKQELYELKFEMMKVSEDRDESQQKLEEFKTVMAALNAKYKLLEQEKLNEKEKISQASENFHRYRKQITTFQSEVNEQKRRIDRLHRENDGLKKEKQTFKEQKDFYLSEREQAIRDRDCAINERDNALQLNRELQTSHDQAIRKQNLLSDQLEKRVFDLTSELEKCKEELGIMQMQLLLHKTEEEQTGVHTCNTTSTEENEIRTENEITHTNEEIYNWRERTKTEVLRSAYKKLNCSSRLDQLENSSSRLDQSENCSSGLDQLEPCKHSNWNLNYGEMNMVFKSLMKNEKSPVSEAFQENIRFFSDPTSLKFIDKRKSLVKDDLALPDEQHKTMERSSMEYSKSLDWEHRKLSRQKGLSTMECSEEHKTDLSHSLSPSRERAYACAGLLKIRPTGLNKDS